MKHFFADTNVLIDFLTQRDTFGLEAAQLFEAVVQRQLVLYVSSLSFSHVYYALRKTNSAAERLDKLTKLAYLVQTIAVDGTVVTQALKAGFSDFEDGIQYCAAATVSSIEYIVTRDPKGFAASQLPVVSPAEALRRLSLP